MKKQRLIPIIILCVMIFNCLLPVLPVKAATNKAIVLNGDLYNAVKEELIEQKITASYNDSQRRIVITEGEIENVKSMDLSNSKIDDISGLENFTYITSLDLSGNELTFESNLGVLNDLKLEFLDLSSNKIEDVSMITNLSEISEINLHSQNISTVEVISLDTSRDSEHKSRVTIKLPQILSLEEINADWLEVGFNDNRSLRPIWTTLSRDEDNVPTLTLDVADFNGDDELYEIHDGALEILINIGDTDTELEDSAMSLFYVVIDNDQRAAVFKDDNFYNAVKEQLTKGQDVNEDLRTYNNYDVEDLYLKAYDAAKVMVFDFNTLINEIPTLRVSGNKITDISGIETFIGLEDEIDLSYNYIDSIDKLIELQENKISETEKLQAKFAKQINEVIKPIRAKLVEHIKAIEAIEEEIERLNAKINAIDEAIEKLEDALRNPDITEEEKKIKATEKDKKIKEKEEAEKLLADDGYESENGYIPSLPEMRREEVASADDYLEMLYPVMDELYKIYNKEYKATTLLTKELYDIGTSEFNHLTKEQSKTMLDNLIKKIQKLESDKAISEFEKKFFKETYSYPERDINKVKIVNPISTYLVSEMTRISEIATAGMYKDYISQIMLIDITSQIFANFASLYLNYEYTGDIDYLPDSEVVEILNKGFEVFIEDAGEEVGSLYVSLNELINSEYRDEYFKVFSNCKEIMINSAQRVTTVDVEKIDQDGNVTTEAKALSQIVGLSGKFTNLTDEEIKRWITLPDIKNINLQNNDIEDIDGIEKLNKLETLNVSENRVVDISEINWAELTKLKELDLHFNFISEISELANIINLEVLNVANNLLSGKFDLNIARMGVLREADFSENAYTDIEPLIQQFRLIAKDEGMDVNEYILNKVNIKLYNQEISVDIAEKILVGSGDPQMIREVELPPIIKQFKELDNERTVFGTRSIYGKVSPEGKVGLIISNEVGKHTGLVTVDTKSGSETQSIGWGTTCTINYTVTAATVNDVLITMNREKAIRGGKTQFEAHVDAVNVWDKTVTWTVDGKTSNDTRIDENGLLKIGEDETAEELRVRATSNYDNSKYLDMKVQVVDADVEVKISKEIPLEYIPAGSNIVYNVEVITEADNKEVSWSISGNQSENTYMKNGILHVGKDEAHGAKITVKATSKYNTEIFDYVVETVVIGGELPNPGDTTKPVEPNPGDTTEPVEPNPGDTTEPVEPNPGDTTKPEEPTKDKIEIKYDTKDDMVYVEKPNTTIADFVKGLVNGEHTITVSDGKGNKLTDYTKLVTTGMVVSIDDSKEDIYEIIVTGDINGDGQVDSMDSNLVKAHRVETKKLEGVYFEAGDINKDGKVNKIDSFLLLYFRADKIDDFSKTTIEAVMK